MKKLQANASGFGIVETLVLFVGIGVISFVGWYVWQAKANASSSYSASADLNLVGASQRVSAESQNTVVKYLAIKELGIKLPLTSDISDLVYSYNKASGGKITGTYYLHFSTDSISSLPNAGFTCSMSHDPLGTYTVYSTRQANEGAADSQVGTLEATVNGHYIYYKHVQYGCGDSTSDANKVAVLIAPLVVAIQKAQPM